MKRRNPPRPEIPPFVDQFGRPAFDNPLGQNRPNPALYAPTQPAPVEALLMDEPETVVELSVRPAAAASSAASAAEARRERMRRCNELRELLASYEMRNDAARVDTYSDTPTALLAERLAADIAEHRSRVHRDVRRGAAVAVTLGAGFVGITSAAAYFKSTGSSNGHGSTGTLTVGVSGTTATPTTPLFPGGTGDVTVNVHNPNNFAVTLKTVNGNGTITPDASHASCSPTGVTFTNQTPNLAIPANATNFAVDLAGAVSMSTASANGCQGATFTIPVAITVQQP